LRPPWRKLVVKTRKQFVALALGATWVSGTALLSGDGLQFVAFALPGIAAAILSYAALSRRFRLATLAIAAAMAAWVSMAILIGNSDCCAAEEQYRHLPHRSAILAGDYVRLNALDGGYLELKTPADVRLEILQLAIPGVLFGLVGIWWIRRKAKEKSERLDWEIDHSPESQPFPELSVANFGRPANTSLQYSFYCYCGMEVIDELPKDVRKFAVACPSCGYEYDLSHQARTWQITACR
jgi:hypothetical protein